MRRLPIVALVLVCLAPTVARASSIDFLGDGKAAAVGIHSPVLGNVNTLAGELLWSWIGGVPSTMPLGSPTSFYTYCVDVNNFVQDPQNNVTVQSTSTLSALQSAYGVSDAGGKAAWLINTYAPAIHALAPGVGNIEAAALQVAIWEVLYDTTPNLTLGSGNFYLTSASAAITSQAEDYLAALHFGSLSNTAYHTADTLWIKAGDGLIHVGQSQAIPTPEPASMLLFGSGLAALSRVLVRRRSPRV